MIYWLAQAAKELRLQTTPTTKQVEIAATVGGIDQSTIYRFEQGQAWPRQTDIVIAAYAEELGLDGRDIWELALTLWREHGDAPVVPRSQRQAVDPADAIEAARQAFARAPTGETQAPAGKRQRPGARQPATGRRRKAS